jgi:hypothetical protein
LFSRRAGCQDGDAELSRLSALKNIRQKRGPQHALVGKVQTCSATVGATVHVVELKVFSIALEVWWRVEEGGLGQKLPPSIQLGTRLRASSNMSGFVCSFFEHSPFKRHFSFTKSHLGARRAEATGYQRRDRRGRCHDRGRRARPYRAWPGTRSWPAPSACATCWQRSIWRAS